MRRFDLVTCQIIPNTAKWWERQYRQTVRPLKMETRSSCVIRDDGLFLYYESIRCFVGNSSFLDNSHGATVMIQCVFNLQPWDVFSLEEEMLFSKTKLTLNWFLSDVCHNTQISFFFFSFFFSKNFLQEGTVSQMPVWLSAGCWIVSRIT